MSFSNLLGVLWARLQTALAGAEGPACHRLLAGVKHCFHTRICGAGPDTISVKELDTGKLGAAAIVAAGPGDVSLEGCKGTVGIWTCGGRVDFGMLPGLLGVRSCCSVVWWSHQDMP